MCSAWFDNFVYFLIACFWMKTVHKLHRSIVRNWMLFCHHCVLLNKLFSLLVFVNNIKRREREKMACLLNSFCFLFNILRKYKEVNQVELTKPVYDEHNNSIIIQLYQYRNVFFHKCICWISIIRLFFARIALSYSI